MTYADISLCMNPFNRKAVSYLYSHPLAKVQNLSSRFVDSILINKVQVSSFNKLASSNPFLFTSLQTQIPSFYKFATSNPFFLQVCKFKILFAVCKFASSNSFYKFAKYNFLLQVCQPCSQRFLSICSHHCSQRLLICLFP